MKHDKYTYFAGLMSLIERLLDSKYGQTAERMTLLPWKMICVARRTRARDKKRGLVSHKGHNERQIMNKLPPSDTPLAEGASSQPYEVNLYDIGLIPKGHFR